MFRGDFEFADDRGPSHLGAVARPTAAAAMPVAAAAPIAIVPTPAPVAAVAAAAVAAAPGEPSWTLEAERELKKIPFFVRGKARRNTERFARERGRMTITLETLYDAKAHFQA
jgi:light-independent protochlorophyllide reductase subunit B